MLAMLKQFFRMFSSLFTTTYVASSTLEDLAMAAKMHSRSFRDTTATELSIDVAKLREELGI
jgi:hypothetical protein